MQTIRIVTRTSELALWQANFIADNLKKHYPALAVELVGVKTQGDLLLDISLAKVGGKGLFVKELEQALFCKNADFAVHSLKDVPYELPQGLVLAAYGEREDPRDVLLSQNYDSIESLPRGARVGTSSLRRQAQLLRVRPDLECALLRGNVTTRIKKCQAGEYDAIILAAAGVKRLGQESKIKQYFPLNDFLPAVGQGVLAIECRQDAFELLELARPLNDPNTLQCALAERAMNRALQGSCQVPIAGYAHISGDFMQLQGRVLTPDGKVMLDAKLEGPVSQPGALGEKVAQLLLNQGAGAIIKQCYK